SRHCRLQVAWNLSRGLGRRVRNVEGMQCEREGLQVAPIAIVRLFPAAHLRLPRRHQQRGLWSIKRGVGPLLASGESLLRVLEVLVRLAQVATNGQGVALDELMNDMKEIRHAQTLQPFFGELDQGLGSVTDHIQHPSAEALES